MFANAKGKQQWKIRQLQGQIISQITVRDCREHIFLLTFLEIAVLTRWLAQLGRLCQGEKIMQSMRENFILI